LTGGLGVGMMNRIHVAELDRTAAGATVERVNLL
jgi:hypothetical protein